MTMAPLRGPEPGLLLARALVALIGPGTAVVAQDRTPWCSATFTGTQHRMVLHCPDRAAATLCAATVAETDFTLRGHLVADIVATADGDRLTIEALTLVEA